MAEERKKLPTYKTPKGIAKWATLNKPDTMFKKEGAYRVTLLLTPEDAKPVIDLIDKGIEEAKAMWKEDPKLRAKKLKEADTPYKQDVNKEGEETGKIAINFTAKASGTKKDGSPWTFRPPVFDAKGNVLPKNVVVFGGSVVKVAYQIRPFVSAPVGAGVSMKLEAVQVLELKALGERAASSYGFGEEEGYVSEEEGSAAEGGEAGASDSAAEENPDF